MFPKVSIVTPSFNQVRFIESTLKSVIDQGYPNLEYIIIDGGSTDGSVDIIERYAAIYPFIRWVSEKDSGQSNAINKGLKMTTGDIVAWINSDDVYDLNAISSAVKCFQENPEVSMVYGDANVVDENGKFVSKFAATEEFNLWRLIHIWDYIMQPTVFWKREIFPKVGFLDESLNWTMDWDFWIRVGMHFKVKYNHVHVADNREYGDTKTSTGGLKRLKEIKRLLKRYTKDRFPNSYMVYAIDTWSKYIMKFFGKIGIFLRAYFFDYFIGHFLMVKSSYDERQKLAYKNTYLSFENNKYRKIKFSINTFNVKDLYPIYVDVFCNSKKIGKISLMKDVAPYNASEPHVVELLLPENLPKLNLVKLVSSSCFIPSRLNKNVKDSRKLSFSFTYSLE